MPIFQRLESLIVKRSGKKRLWVGAMAVLCLLASTIGAAGGLDHYREAVGSSLERRILAYARACIVRELDPGVEPPEHPIGTETLPKTGLYLTLMKGRDVRACVGRFSPPASDLAESIGALAKEIVYYDIRKQPLSLHEMVSLSLVLSFVGPRRAVSDPYDVDFSKEGLCMTREGRHAVLLPGETKTLDYGIKMLSARTGLRSGDPVSYAAFKVVAFDERRW